MRRVNFRCTLLFPVSFFVEISAKNYGRDAILNDFKI